jgi:hypothetical protein
LFFAKKVKLFTFCAYTSTQNWKKAIVYVKKFNVHCTYSVFKKMQVFIADLNMYVSIILRKSPNKANFVLSPFLTPLKDILPTI